MRQYRIVTALTNNGRPVFHVQYRDRWIWWTVKDICYFSELRMEFGTQKDAEFYIQREVSKDEAKAVLKKKHKEFKSKVVYGPYPP